MNILVNNKIINFTHDDFPMLVSGKAFVKSGASFFSVSLMTKLFENGEKIVFFTALPPAKKLFREQVGDRMNNNIIMIDSGEEEVFLESIDKIKDFSERIVLFKNIENYNQKLFDKLKDKELIIFSGDIDKCAFADDLLKKDFKTKIFFSYPDKVKITNKIDLPQYYGYIESDKYNGLISLDLS